MFSQPPCRIKMLLLNIPARTLRLHVARSDLNRDSAEKHRNASTRLSMNGKISNDLNCCSVRSFVRLRTGSEASRRMNGGFSAESIIMSAPNRLAYLSIGSLLEYLNPFCIFEQM